MVSDLCSTLKPMIAQLLSKAASFYEYSWFSVIASHASPQRWLALVPLPNKPIGPLHLYFAAVIMTIIHRFTFALFYMPLVSFMRAVGLTTLYLPYNFGDSPQSSKVPTSLFEGYLHASENSSSISNFVFRYLYWAFYAFSDSTAGSSIHDVFKSSFASKSYCKIVTAIDNYHFFCLLLVVARYIKMGIAPMLYERFFSKQPDNPRNYPEEANGYSSGLDEYATFTARCLSGMYHYFYDFDIRLGLAFVYFGWPTAILILIIHLLIHVTLILPARFFARFYNDEHTPQVNPVHGMETSFAASPPPYTSLQQSVAFPTYAYHSTANSVAPPSTTNGVAPPSTTTGVASSPTTADTVVRSRAVAIGDLHRDLRLNLILSLGPILRRRQGLLFASQVLAELKEVDHSIALFVAAFSDKMPYDIFMNCLLTWEIPYGPYAGLVTQHCAHAMSLTTKVTSFKSFQKTLRVLDTIPYIAPKFDEILDFLIQKGALSHPLISLVCTITRFHHPTYFSFLQEMDKNLYHWCRINKVPKLPKNNPWQRSYVRKEYQPSPAPSSRGPATTGFKSSQPSSIVAGSCQNYFSGYKSQGAAANISDLVILPSRHPSRAIWRQGSKRSTISPDLVRALGITPVNTANPLQLLSTASEVVWMPERYVDLEFTLNGLDRKFEFKFVVCDSYIAPIQLGEDFWLKYNVVCPPRISLTIGGETVPTIGVRDKASGAANHSEAIIAPATAPLAYSKTRTQAQSTKKLGSHVVL